LSLSQYDKNITGIFLSNRDGKMSNQKIQQILKKITYLEAEIEIQKQILFSIPSADKGEIESTIRIIAARKSDIENLRQQINDLNPEEFARIVAFEEASARFMAIGAENKFTDLFHKQIGQECDLKLADGTIVNCLVKARDEKGGWTLLTSDGEVLQFTREQVLEQADEVYSPDQSLRH
jgi:hypothetical protein